MIAMGQKRSVRVTFGYIKGLDTVLRIRIFFKTLFIGLQE